jgi:hypothetical protein
MLRGLCAERFMRDSSVIFSVLFQACEAWTGWFPIQSTCLQRAVCLLNIDPTSAALRTVCVVLLSLATASLEIAKSMFHEKET